MTGAFDMDKSFIIVKYGDNEEAIFNPWCPGHTLMEWIRKKCNCDEDVTIDLVDLDGQVSNISGRSKEYANELVTGRGTYILIRVEKLPENGQYHYTSLLNNLEDVNPDLMVKLNSLSRPQTRGKLLKQKVKQARQLQPSKGERRPISTERKKGR